MVATIVLVSLVCLGLTTGLYAFSQEHKMRLFADKEVSFLRDELEELRRHLRANQCKVRAEANFDAYAFQKGHTEYVHQLVECLLHSLADNVAKVLRCYVMQEVLDHVHDLAYHDITRVVIDLPVVREDIGGADVYAVGQLGELCPLMDRGPMKELKERNEAAIAAAAMAEPDWGSEEIAKQLLEGFGMCKPEELEDERC